MFTPSAVSTLMTDSRTEEADNLVQTFGGAALDCTQRDFQITGYLEQQLVGDHPELLAGGWFGFGQGIQQAGASTGRKSSRP